MASDTSLEALIQGLFERAINSETQAYAKPAKIKPDTAGAREKERLAAQLRSGKELVYDTVTSEGRLLGVKYQPSKGGQPALATAWTLVQPSKSASLTCSFSAAEEARGFSSAGMEVAVDFGRRLGMDCEFELAQGRAWSGEASIFQRLPLLPLTLQHAVKAGQPAVGSAQRERIAVTQTTSTSLALPYTTAELRVSLAMPSSLAAPLPLRRAAAALVPSPSPSSPTLATPPQGQPFNPPPMLRPGSSTSPAAAAEQSLPLQPPPPAAAARRRKLTFKLQLRGSNGEKKPLGQQAGCQASHRCSQPAAMAAEPSEVPQQEKKRSAQSYIPKLQVDISLPEEGLQHIAPQDVGCSWRQAWGSRISTCLALRHAGPGTRRSSGGISGGGNLRRTERLVGRQGDAVSALDSFGSSDDLLSENDTSNASSSSTGSFWRSSNSLGVGLAAGAKDGGSPVGGPPAGAARSAPSWDAAAVVKTALLSCALNFKLGGSLTASASTQLDGSSLDLQGSGRWGLPSRSAVLGAAKSSRLKLKYKAGGSSSSSNGTGKGGAKRAVSLQSSLDGAGQLSHALTLQHGGKNGDGEEWVDMQRARTQLSLRVRPAAKWAWSLDFDFFVPFC